MSTGSIGQTQIRMVQPGTPRIGQTTIRPTTPQVIRTTANQIRPMTTIRGQTTIMQTNNQVPALHPVSGATIISAGAQVSYFHTSQNRLLLLSKFFIKNCAMEAKCSIVSMHGQKNDKRFLFLFLFYIKDSNCEFCCLILSC